VITTDRLSPPGRAWPPGLEPGAAISRFMVHRLAIWIEKMVAAAGIAPAFQCFQGTALHSSISPRLKKWKLVEATGLAPAARCLQGSIASVEHAPPLN